ncbi:FmdB family zinc ribbon protein [Luteolibacter sp. AS25]|uniref:FmdB family zinc ribbon protein n=1 Tax=Luteolibacter sp. AS25 TaxID=3135776 RepID=UPI00398B07D8
MPLYDFTCRDCGDFRELRTIAERSDPAACPTCKKVAQRLILAPGLALMDGGLRKAHGVNEKSRHEPSIRESHSCSSRCGCGSGGDSKIRKNTVKETKLGKLQSQKATARPWMLGH